jgi:hypothetical protein
MNKVSKAHLKFYKRLIDTPSGIPQSSVPSTLPLDQLMSGNAIESKRVGAGNTLTCKPYYLRAALRTLFDIRDLEGALDAFDTEISKGAIALVGGTTKSLSAGRKRQSTSMRACAPTGNPCVSLSKGTLEIPTLQYACLNVDCGDVDTLTNINCAIICENIEDFDMLTYPMFEQLCQSPSSAIVLSRDDGLERIGRVIKNTGIARVWHFGDFDLCGMQIFETNTVHHIPSARFLMPELNMLGSMIRSHGSEELYYKQLDRTRRYIPNWSEGKELMHIIHKYKKVIEQETVRELLSRKHF